MNATYLLWILAGAAAVAAFIAIDRWMDNKPGGRKYDEALEYLAAYERYLRALERQNTKHVRIGHKDDRETR